MHSRRHILRLAAAAPLAVFLPGRTTRVNAMDAAAEEAATILAGYYKADLAVTCDTAADRLRQLEHPVNATSTDRARAARIRAGARLRALRGQTLSDLGELDQARRSLNLAHLDAVQIGDRGLVAYIRGLQAAVEDRDCHWTRALALLADGSRHAGPQLRVRLRAQSLGPLASLGRRAEFTEVLAYAREIAAEADLPDTAVPSFDGTDRATVARFALEGFARFGVGEQRDEARDEGNLKLLAAVDDAHLSGPACTMRLDLASALMVEEPDHACALMAETVEIVTLFGAPAPTLVDRAGRVLRGADHRVPVVRDTADLLRTTWQVAA